MCDALVDDQSTARGYIQGFTTYKSKNCSRKAVVSVGPLKLCQVHGRLCKEGFLAPNGQTTPATMINDCRNRKTDRYMYDWALELPIISLVLPSP